jgi:hypothetical protein
MVWLWEVIVALDKRGDVLGDRADLEMLLGS